MMRKLLASILVSVITIGVIPVAASAAWKEDIHKNTVWIENGTVATGWRQVDGNWYNFGNNGIAQTGWLMDNGQWYYMWSDGTMAHDSWLTNGGLWYYFDKNGKMVSDSSIINNRKYDFSKTAVILSEDIDTATNIVK